MGLAAMPAGFAVCDGCAQAVHVRSGRGHAAGCAATRRRQRPAVRPAVSTSAEPPPVREAADCYVLGIPGVLPGRGGKPDRVAKVLSLNARVHWSARAPMVAAVRRHVAAQAAGIGPQPAIGVTLTYHPPTRARRDRMNLVGVLKAAVDGLCPPSSPGGDDGAGVIPDDTPDRLDDRMPRIGEAGRPERFTLTVTPLRRILPQGGIPVGPS